MIARFACVNEVTVKQLIDRLNPLVVIYDLSYSRLEDR